MPIDRLTFLGVPFDPLTQGQVIERLRAVTPQSPYSYVVTPNVDHVLEIDRPALGEDLLPIYRGAGWSLCDSRIVQLLARLRGVNLPLVTGSDLTVAIFRHVLADGDRIAIVSPTEALAEALRKVYPRLDIVHVVPPLGLRRDAAAREAAAQFVAEAGARFTFLAVGTPQQEMIAAAVASHGEARGTALCIGASLDFIVGSQRRAPLALQRLHLEWAYRLMRDPRRLWRRYLVKGPRIFALAARRPREAR